MGICAHHKIGTAQYILIFKSLFRDSSNWENSKISKPLITLRDNLMKKMGLREDHYF